MKVHTLFQFSIMFIFALLLVDCVSNSTPTRSTVQIIVTEPDGRPVGGAAVSINGRLMGETDANGILPVSRLDGQITVSKEGYFSNTITAVKDYRGLRREQIVWLTRSNSGTISTTYSRGSLTRGQLRDMNTGIVAAIIRVSRNLVRELPKNHKIAVLSITASDEDIVTFVTDGIEQQLFDAGYSLVDRSELDKIRLEQNLQLSGEVDDNQAVSIGKLAAARIVVTGIIVRTGNLQILTLRALDVETGELISRASDQF